MRIRLRQEQYYIRVKGHLQAAWFERCNGLTSVSEDGGEAIISGPIVVHSVLHGVLARVHALNLPSVSVSKDEPRLDDIFT